MIKHFGGYNLEEIHGQLPTLPSFSVQERVDRYVVGPFSYQNGLYRISLSKELLDLHRWHTQDEWVDFLKNSEWQLPSGPLLMGLMTKLYEEREGKYTNIIKKIQKKLRQDFKDKWMVTSTRINHHTDRLDEVIHDYRRDEQIIEGDVFGPHDWVTPASGFEGPMERLFGTRNLALLEDVSQWCSGKKPYLWRYRFKVNDAGALVLGGYNDSFDVYAIAIDIDGPARGVSVQKIGDL